MLSESLLPETTDFSSLVTALRPLIVLPVVSLPDQGPVKSVVFSFLTMRVFVCTAPFVSDTRTTTSARGDQSSCRSRMTDNKQRLCLWCVRKTAREWGVQPRPGSLTVCRRQPYRWVSVKVVCSFVTELKPLMAFIRSSSSRYWKEAVSLG